MGYIKRVLQRAFAPGLPYTPEGERFGADGEEAVYRLLREKFDCVLRNILVPFKDIYLEKDFLVISKGVPFVIEVKNWKGEIGYRDGAFYQKKPNGVLKMQKNPVDTSKRFSSSLAKFYELDRPIYSVVVFAEPDCTTDELPRTMDGVALCRAPELCSYIRGCVRDEGRTYEPVTPERFLCCSRLYQGNRDFCKGVIANNALTLYTEAGEAVSLDTSFVRYMKVKRLPFRACDRVIVTFHGGSSTVLYNRTATLTLHCMDGSFRKIALHRTKYVLV